MRSNTHPQQGKSRAIKHDPQFVVGAGCKVCKLMITLLPHSSPRAGSAYPVFTSISRLPCMHIQTAQGRHYTASEKLRAGRPRQDGCSLKVILSLHSRLTHSDHRPSPPPKKPTHLSPSPRHRPKCFSHSHNGRWN